MNSDSKIASLELFSGAGGLALGLSMSGFKHHALIERDKHSCETLRANIARSVGHVKNWNIIEDDIRHIKYDAIGKNIDMVSGGPPCQPFSLGGKHGGYNDGRDMFPEAVRAIRQITPKAFVFENVRGLLRKSFSSYLNYIVLQLSYPLIKRKGGESWHDHLSRLERHHTSSKASDLSYRVVYRLINAADYGIPQHRHRVIIVGFRADQRIEWSFPNPTHSFERLLWEQWVTGEYWERHGIRPRYRHKCPRAHELLVNKIRVLNEEVEGQAYLTVRDAISDLPSPTRSTNSGHVLNHIYRAGARIYPGHTGSLLDDPAKTLKAGDHGVPGGENMLRNVNGVRYFTVRESARLQTFPDEYCFTGSWTESMRQIGNAVPVMLAKKVGDSVIAHLQQRACRG